MFRSINPATEKVLHEYQPHTADEVQAKLKLAEEAWQTWRKMWCDERGSILKSVAHLLRERQSDLSRLMTAEMGKPIKQARAEVEKCAWCCEFYATHAAEFLEPKIVATDAARSLVRFDPIGAVLAIMPWNFPLWQVIRCAAPALMAGNVVLLKHATNVIGSALALEVLLADAGLPAGTFQALLIGHEEIEPVLQHPLVQGVSLTGSERAGMSVAAAAGKHLKKCVLELGGSDPFIVLADADVESVAAMAVKARCQNSGQSCIAAKRFFVEKSIAEIFEAEFARQMQKLNVGDPLDEGCDIGPLARKDLVDTLHDQVQRTIAAGAKLVTGGKRLSGRGNFYQPTLLAEVTPTMPAFVEETFGPVAALITVRDAAEAIALANQSNYGLGASIWTADTDRALSLAAELQSGSVFINEIVKSDPRLPFGGVKHSGYGRELAEYGLHEFVNVKTVWVK